MRSNVSNWSLYGTGFIRDVHQMLVWGYEASRPKFDSDTEEDVITGFIAEAIFEKLSSDAPRRFTRYDIKDQAPVRGSSRTGKRRKRLDVVMVHTKIQPYLEFVFEAKRLKTNGFPIGEYIGNEGMQRFLRSQYAAEHPVAGMLGYIQSDDAQRWFVQLQDSFDKDTANILRIVTNLATAPIHSLLPNEWESEHSRSNSLYLRLFHIFLDCS